MQINSDIIVPPRPTVVVSVLIIKDGRLLLARRKIGNHAGKLDTPGGKLESGESFEEAAARELFEEAGLVASEFRKFDVFNAYEPGIASHAVIVFMLAVFANGDPVNMEPDKKEDWQWWDPVQQPRDELLPSIRSLLHDRLFDLLQSV